MNICADVLKKTIQGNFPGTKIETVKDTPAKEMLNNVVGKIGDDKAIASVTCIPSFRHEQEVVEKNGE